MFFCQGAGGGLFVRAVAAQKVPLLAPDTPCLPHGAWAKKPDPIGRV